jgi:prepilin-type N-terminal cleavage/methylation domain-containing protein
MMHTRHTAASRHALSAFSLMEVMVALMVLSIVGVAVGVGMQSAVHTPEANDLSLALSTELTSEMEAWRAVAFGPAPWPTSFPYTFTDTVPLNVGGRQLTCPRTTTITLWDPNNLATNTTPQTDFAQISITINSQTVTAYLTKSL